MPTKKKEYKGKNIDEAIAAACSDLKSRQDELDVEVVSAGSAGIFGLCKKKAIILASRRARSHNTPEAIHPVGVQPSAKPRHHPRSNRDNDRPRDKPKRDAVSRPDGAALPAPSPEVINEIKELLTEILRLMDFQPEISMSAVGNKLTAHIVAHNNPEEIIGRDGSTLDALQYLMRKIITQKFPEKINLNLDAGNYREDRQKELEALALEMATKVKETGKSQIISALNPAERRIVHVALQDDSGIRSASIGEGLFKKVRISLPGQGRKRSGSHDRGRSSAAEESAVS